MVVSLKRVDSTGTATIVFTGVDNISDRDSTASVEISAPNQDATETTTFNLSGLKRFISFNFKLQNDGTDKSDGTGTNIINIDRQYGWIKDTLVSGKTEAQYFITIGTLLFNVEVGLVDLTLKPTFANPDYYNGSLQVSIGKNPLAITT